MVGGERHVPGFRGEQGRATASGRLLALPLLMVTAMSVVFVLLLAAFPRLVFQSLVRSALS